MLRACVRSESAHTFARALPRAYSVGTWVAVTLIWFTHRLRNNQSELSSEPRFLRNSTSYREPVDPRTTHVTTRVTRVETSLVNAAQPETFRECIQSNLVSSNTVTSMLRLIRTKVGGPDLFPLQFNVNESRNVDFLARFVGNIKVIFLVQK